VTPTTAGTRLLAIADEEDESLTPARLSELRPDLVVSCGDLTFEYLDYVASATNAPMIMVPGNHDPDLRGARSSDSDVLGPPVAAPEPILPEWCTSVDGRAVRTRGVVVAGLGGSMRYRPGPNQYTEREMSRRATLLQARVRMGRRRLAGGRVDVLLTHAAPQGVGDADDLCHRGFACFHRLVDRLRPRYLIHGHIHPYGQPRGDRRLGSTIVVNAVSHRLLELPGGDDGRR
jgi:Icc-related predicted phosphoesterase